MRTDWLDYFFGYLESDETLGKLSETGVILIHGANTMGQSIYSYIELSMYQLEAMKLALDNGENVLPSRFGKVIQAGIGNPSEKVQREMAIRYNLRPVTTT